MGALVESITAAGARRHHADLVDILVDAVDSGASVGFLPPLSRTDAAAYWRSVEEAMAAGARVLLVAHGDGGVVGTAQLDLARRPNGLHRAEVTKVMVHRGARRQGVGRALMLAAEAHARALGRTTLVLDTRQGDPSERLYAAVGWRLAGVIPRYARSADGMLHATAFYYKCLETA